MTTMQADIYQTVTDRIVSALETGTVPWLRPWNGKSGDASEPHNAATGRAYNGINTLILGTSRYASAGWLTYRQAQEMGGNVRKGEHGTQIVFWQFNAVKDEDTGKSRTIPFARGYTVFNVAQCDGLDASRVHAPVAPVAGEGAIFNLATAKNCEVRHGGNRAFYTTAGDYVQMPSAADFKSAAAYDATLAHEMTHWTGGSARLARQFGRRFGDEAYAFEELVAEIGSAFVCAKVGVELTKLQHAAYLASWLRVLKADKRAIFTASSQARKAADYLTGADAGEERLAA